MERQKKVVDASVIVKLFLDEDKTKKAIDLIESHFRSEITIIVPELIFLEVLNALRFKKDYKDGLDGAQKVLQNAQFSIITSDFYLLNKAVRISLEYNLSMYDALYAALSQIYGCELITEDKELGKFPSAVGL